MGCISLLPASAAELGAKPAPNPELERLVDDVCRKPVVVLGEDSGHGAGNSIATKVSLVERLIDRCGFSAVLFESPIYDFVDLERQYAAGTAESLQLADAVGAIWSATREFDPLVDYLHRKASTGKVRLGGIDFQPTSATSAYQHRRLAADLTRQLPAPDRGRCESEIDRHTNWRYSDQSLYDNAALERLRACANSIESSLNSASRSEMTQRDALMAANLSKYFQFQNLSGTPDASLRDLAMYENVVWYRAHLPSNAKIIIWCATIHGAKQSRFPAGKKNMGLRLHELLGDRLAVIGFSALSGNYGRQKPQALAPASPDSLEARAFADSRDRDVRYLDAKELRRFGKVSARAISYGASEKADWSELVDGLIVLGQERPVEIIHEAKPRQTER